MDQIETTAMGTRRHSFVGVKGDLRVELHYADVRDGAGRQACLYLFRARAPKDGVLVPFGELWRYRDEAGRRSMDVDASAEVIGRSAKALSAQLYGVSTRTTEFRVLDAIMDYAEDLKNHRPEPGLDKTLDQFLEECDREDLGFFVEVGGKRVIG